MLVVNLRRLRKPIALATATILTMPSTVYAAPYVKGTIIKKAEPIIELMKEAVEPIAYGVMIWSLVLFMLGHKAEAKDKVKGVLYGVVGIKLLPWFFDILNSVGV
jgi:hypothetical protein